MTNDKSIAFKADISDYSYMLAAITIKANTNGREAIYSMTSAESKN